MEFGVLEASAALKLYEEHGCEGIVDLICDLLHLADIAWGSSAAEVYERVWDIYMDERVPCVHTYEAMEKESQDQHDYTVVYEPVAGPDGAYESPEDAAESLMEHLMNHRIRREEIPQCLEALRLGHSITAPTGSTFRIKRRSLVLTEDLPAEGLRFEAQSKLPEGKWSLDGIADTPSDAAEELWESMELAGIRHSELRSHVEDLAAGHILTAEDGTAFRVVRVTSDSTDSGVQDSCTAPGNTCHGD